MSELVLFLEEASAKAAFQGLLPRILPKNVTVRYVVFEGKSDLEKQLGRKLRGWCTPNTSFLVSFLVLLDQDSEDCKAVKERVRTICSEAGKPDTVVRIACHELESWYFGDLEAVAQGLSIPKLEKQASKAKYRTPDDISYPSKVLRTITSNKYQKVAGSRAIGRHLNTDPTRNASVSFKHFILAIKAVLHDTQTKKPKDL